VSFFKGLDAICGSHDFQAFDVEKDLVKVVG